MHQTVIDVAVAVIIDESNRICISKRHADSHQGGLWEFPGGKFEPGETIEQALQREIAEELGIDVTRSRPLIRIQHDYGDKAVCLHVHKVMAFQGEAVGLEGQEVKWVSQSALAQHEFPAANIPIIRALDLPERYLITGKFESTDDYIQRLHKALSGGIQLVQCRLKAGCFSWAADTHAVDSQAVDTQAAVTELVQQSAALCRQYDAELLLNISHEYLDLLDLVAIPYAGFHADSRMLDALDSRPDDRLFSASCHDERQLQKALELGADFVVLSPVQATASHPDTAPMGWQRFEQLIRSMPVPVYALGGVGNDDIETAWQHGGQGVAAISAFWPDKV